jgi:integrase
MRSIQHLWESILGQAGLGKLRIHDLRHTLQAMPR